MNPRSIVAYVLCALALAGAFTAVRMSLALDSDATTVSVAAPRNAVSALTDFAPGLEAPDAFTLVSSRSFLTGIEARSKNGNVNVVVEIPAGSVDKWEVDKSDGTLRWEMRDGEPRRVRYLGYPGNYGMIPRTLLPEEEGGDGDPLDVLILGPSVPRGAVVEARVVGVLSLLDAGERDDKLLAVRPGTSMAEVIDLADLQESFPGVTAIVETWFAHYKGPGAIETRGFRGADEARRVLDAAIRAFEARDAGS